MKKIELKWEKYIFDDMIITVLMDKNEVKIYRTWTEDDDQIEFVFGIKHEDYKYIDIEVLHEKGYFYD